MKIKATDLCSISVMCITEQIRFLKDNTLESLTALQKPIQYCLCWDCGSVEMLSKGSQGNAFEPH